MSEDMPEDMSDRMLEDLSIRKCINVMVGITRNKKIRNLIYILLFLIGKKKTYGNRYLLYLICIWKI